MGRGPLDPLGSLGPGLGPLGSGGVNAVIHEAQDPGAVGLGALCGLLEAVGRPGRVDEPGAADGSRRHDDGQGHGGRPQGAAAQAAEGADGFTGGRGT